MAEQQAKKLNLTLYLNPVVSEADQVAMTALQRWYEKTKRSCGGQAGPELEGLIRSFHHDLYLAGLHLHLINPRLCHRVADSLGPKQPTLETLIEQLSAAGLWSKSQEDADKASFSPVQLEQMERLLGATPAGADQPPPAGDAAASALSQQLSEQHEQISSLHGELQKLRLLAEEQAQQLREIKFAVPRTPAPPPVRASGTEEMDVSGMTAQLAQMQKIRRKGVF